MTLTPAQQKALVLLPSDGKWDFAFNRSYALIELIDADSGLVELTSDTPVHLDGCPFRFRLTPKGIAYKAGREG